MGNAFGEISAGLSEAIEHAKGNTTNVVEHKPEWINVKEIRQKTGMNQQKFCTLLGVSITTLRYWEQGLHYPRGAAKMLLKVLQHNPNAVINAIQE
ncbi:MAG: helix-turn-helix domain-containing protein [Methylococcaceae bacterium]|nr:helix-turn-helix domain-containing protein [Methylococcaceae bacterium]